MTNHDRATSTLKAQRIHLIREFVDLQQKLVMEAISKLAPSATEYDFKESLPDAVTIDDGEWSAKAHGLGVLFTNRKTGAVVDVHVGFMDAPAGFDAWRLVQFSESLLGTTEDFKSWQDTLDELCGEGIIEPHTKHERHYSIA